MTARSDSQDSSTPFPFQWEDPLLLADQLTAEEKMVRDAARVYADTRLMPRVQRAFQDELFDRDIYAEMGAQGFLGATLKGYGCAGVSPVAYGLIAGSWSVWILPIVPLSACSQVS